jgi:hypothetical protein
VNYFFKLVIDKSTTNELDVFRLAESRGVVIVSEKIANVVRDSDFRDIELILVSQ